MLFLWCLMLLVLAHYSTSSVDPPPPCFSDIYCHGNLLKTIQMAKVFQDSKTFVDMKLKHPPNETMNRFLTFMKNHNDEPSRKEIKGFLNQYFEPANSEFETWDPEDWTEYPKFLDRIKDHDFREWASSLNLIWKDLGRKIKEEIKTTDELYSIIYVKNGVIVPGGRFREFYYWDTYWIMLGLLLSEMNMTVKGMLENFIHIVNTYGHIPNGGRIYYLERSQPPLFIPMVKLYLDYTKDIQFLKDNIGAFEKEYSYWIERHSRTVVKDGKNYPLAVYGDRSYGPRPESYSEDVESARIFPGSEKKEEYYSELKAAAESGWDFSSRWFILNGTNEGNLTNIKTRSIIPVDLNAILYWNAELLSEFHTLIGNIDKAMDYKRLSETWLGAIDAVLWHDDIGVWLDYDILTHKRRDYFYPSNIAPLWTGSYKKENKDRMVRLVMKYLQNENILSPGGVATTKVRTGEQWDYPNAWPPLQHMMVVGLNNTGDPHAVRLAYEIARNWIRSNHKAFKETTAMFEKYNAATFGGHGGGGEYEVQLGFGWSNGVIMDLLYKYGYSLTKVDFEIENNEVPVAKVPVPAKDSSEGTFGQVSAVLVALLVSLTAGFIG